MVKPHTSLVVRLSAATIVAISLLGSAIAANACPFEGTTRPADTLFQPGTFNDQSGEARLSDESKPFSAKAMGLVGFGAVAGLFAIAILYSIRRRDLSPAEAALLYDYPELEHPELALTSIPKEALPLAALDAEVVSVR